jgi:hypothetical protein
LIYFNGCSFTNGYELKNKFTDRYSTLVTNHYNKEEKNDAKVGGSNDRVWRCTINQCLTKQPDLVIIMWTGINRMEYLQTGQNISGNAHKSSDQTSLPRWRATNWKDYALSHRTLEIDKDTTNLYQHPDLTNHKFHYLNGYMKEIRNIRWNLKYTISYMLSTKHFLESLDIPYLFYTFSSGQYKPFLYLLDEEYLEAANNYWDSLELSKKQVVKELPCLKADGFYDLAVKHKLPIGKKDHPLEEAHSFMADKIIQDIKHNEIY